MTYVQSEDDKERLAQVWEFYYQWIKLHIPYVRESVEDKNIRYQKLEDGLKILDFRCIFRMEHQICTIPNAAFCAIIK